MYRSADNMILYIINPKLHTKKQLELISEFARFGAQKFNIKTLISIALMYSIVKCNSRWYSIVRN